MGFSRKISYDLCMDLFFVNNIDRLTFLDAQGVHCEGGTEYETY